MRRRVLSLMITLTLCLNLCPVWVFAAGEGTDGGLCPHHPSHTDECGYVPENPGASCTFDCQLCPVEDLSGQLPDSVSEDNSEQVRPDEIYDLYDGLTADEQQQVDLSPSLQDQLDGAGLAALSDDSDGEVFANKDSYELENDHVQSGGPYKVSTGFVLNTGGHTFKRMDTTTDSAAILVTGTGELHLTGGGEVISQKGDGVKVQSGGSLIITDPGTDISALEYALNIASGAKARLSAGTYYSFQDTAIRTEDNDFAALLEPGYAYFDGNGDPGNPLLPADVGSARMVVIRRCSDHSGKVYTYTPGATTHTWTCLYCGVTGSEPCTFDFVRDGDGTGACADCGNRLSIAVNEDDLTGLVYDGTLKPADVRVTVTLTDPDGNTTELTRGTDFTVDIQSITNAGQATVTVTGITFTGTFVKTYNVAQAQPGIRWDAPTAELDYDGRRTTIKDELPDIIITLSPTNNEDLRPYIRYSYREDGDTEFTDGLPLDAGEYEVKAYIPESQNYEAAETNPCLTLTIKAINPVTAAPRATKPTYNGTAQALVTAGTVDSRAAGAEILFSTSENGDYSTTIPTGINAGDHEVWYKVEGTNNYTAVPSTKIDGTEILRKEITPIVKLLRSSYPYDGTRKTPEITVKDDQTVIDENQYTVTWAGTKNQTPAEMLTVADTYTATIKSVDSGNYTFNTTAAVEIVAADQEALYITGQPSYVCYGDTVTTLRTTGGSGNGKVTWSITDGGSNSTINTTSGELTVKDTGSITVKAERTVTNYKTASDTWIFTVKPKPVTAEVTIKPRDYDGTTNIANSDITAAVKADDLVDSSDSFTINTGGLTAAYDDANTGTNKTVTLSGNITTTADTAKYSVSYPATTTGDITPKSVTVTVTLSDHDLKTDANSKYYYVFDGAEKKPNVTVTGVASGYSATLAAGDYSVSYAGNKNAGTATVTVRNAAGGNYTFSDEMVNFEIRSGAAVLTSTPQAKDLTYNGTGQDLVTVGTATGGTVVYSLSPADPNDKDAYSETIPQGKNAGEYTVYYMVKGDANHDSTVPGRVSVTIKSKEITPKITLNPTSYVYDGTAHTPGVTVEDGSDTIATEEYVLTYRDNTNAGTATVIVSDANGGNYIVNGTATFEITEAAPVVTAPVGKTDLQYSGAPQELVKAGVTGHGTVVYSVDGGDYTPAIPTATAVGQYTISYKVLGDANHKDTDPVTLTAVTIARNKVTTPAITLSSNQFTYNGGQQKPTITVCDDRGLLIPEREYTVTITGVKGDNMVDVDTYTVKITTPSNSNYDITDDGSVNTRTFKIVEADQETISITGIRAQVRYGDDIQLGITGGTGTGTVNWTIAAKNGGTVNSTVSAGLIAVRDTGGPFTVTVTRSRGGNYQDVSATWEFSAAKKQVTAVVTADDRFYADGNNSATVTATVPNSELVPGDSITISGVNGTFDNPNVGPKKKVTLTGGTVGGTDADKYDVTIPATTTASILPKAAEVNKKPTANTLTYDASRAQALVTAGTANGGNIMVYSLDGTNFTAAIPTAKDAGDYPVYYKAQGDGNHTDSAVDSVKVTIAQQTVTPQIELTPPSASYDGQVKRPEVTLRDNDNNVIPTSEYKATYVTDGGANWTDQGTYTVKIENITGGNYIIADGTKATFKIGTKEQNPLEIVSKPGLVYYGYTFTLSAVGGSGNAAVVWTSTDDNIAHIDENGFVTIKGTGRATITATKPGGTNYDTMTATYPLNALKKPITAIVTAEDRVYASGDTSATIHVTWKDGDLVGNDTIDTSALSGTFEDDSVGANKTVTITGGPITDSRYDITIPADTTASIRKADVTGVNPPTAKTDLKYTGSAQDLVEAGSATGGAMEYSTDGINYSTSLPQGTNAGTYTVWYKVADSVNYNGIAAVEMDVEIAKAEPSVSTEPTASGTTGQKLSDITLNDGEANVSGKFAWADGSITPTNGNSYDVIFTPDDTVNYEPCTFKITVTVNPSSNGSTGGGSGSTGGGTNTLSTNTPNALMQTTVRSGTANTVLSAAAGSRLVSEAVASQSRNVIIKPEVTSDVTRTEVSIPASTVSRLGSATDADLTVSGPIADVTISNTALDTLSQAGGTVSVAAEQVEQSVVLTLTAGGENVEQVPGGLTLTVPVEDAGPGTVAVLVHEDGTRETVRKSLVEDGVMSIPLSGSATVEIVDNSKDFADVPPESWAAGAVAFASAHELFSGTSETTFSPDQVMSRGMLATVLYRLDGSPELDLTNAFDDVSDDAWYAEGVAWALENRIASGYGDSQFGPNDNITREQFVVMLWRYAGSPEASSQTLDFTDADQVSGYAQKALCWAVENGILSGVGNGMLNPDGLATRAQAAQLLKNFMENT